MKRVFVVLCLLQLAIMAAPAEAKPVKRHPGNTAGTGYLVLLTPEMASGVRGLAQSLTATYNLRLVETWHAIGGFYCEGPLEAATMLANDPRVDVVEEDHKWTGPVSQVQSTYIGINDEDAYTDDLWFLDRLDELNWADANTPRDDTYNWCMMTGANTTAYIMDYGVWKAHAAFDGRVVRTVDCTTSPCDETRDAAELCRVNDPFTFINYFDHGTKVASLLTGVPTGAARPAVVSVNLFDCPTNGQPNLTTAQRVVRALNWIKEDVQKRKVANTFKPSVVNHSGFIYPWSGESSVVTNAGQQVVAEDIPYFTSADNFSGDSCAFAPNNPAYTPNSRTGSFFVVGGTTMDGGVGNQTMPDGTVRRHYMRGTKDYVWKQTPAVGDPKGIERAGTNLGNCVSAFAPAVFIHTAVHYNRYTAQIDSTAYDSNFNLAGTSFSSPLAAGLALRWMAWQSPRPTYKQVYDFLLNSAQKAIDHPNGVPVTNAAYTICYDPNNINDWAWNSDPNHSCTAPLTSKYVMPAAGQTSGARMIYYPYCGN